MEKDIIKRLKEILDYFKLSPSKLADEISINRSRLSHILNGRNNPTLEVIQGILTKYNDINPDWLLFGQGAMIRSGIEPNPKDLFQYAELNKKKKQPNEDSIKPELSKSITNEGVIQSENIISSDIITKKTDKPANNSIKRITVFYSNNDYQDFISE